MLIDCFFTVLQMSLYGAGAALLVWLCCLGLRRAGAPRSLCCALWLAVLACLVLPRGIPVPVQPTAPAAAVTQALTGAQARLTQAAQASDEPAAADKAAPVWPQALTGIWLAGAAGLALYGIAADRRLHRQVALAYRATAEDGTVYYTGDCVTTPFVAGLVRPRIYLPTGLTATQRRHILLHEQAHLRRRDNWVRPLFYLSLCLHWFNPLIWLACRQMVLDMESACDEAALRRLGEDARPAYCQSLFQFALRGSSLVSPLAFGESSTKARIRRILTHRRPRLAVVLGCGVLALAVAAGCLLRPVAAAAPDTGSPFSTGTGAAAPDSGSDAAVDAGPVSLAELLQWPVPDYRYCSRWASESHKGVDICAAAGTPIYAAAGGVVIVAGYGTADDTAETDAPLSLSDLAAYDSYGYVVVIDHGDGYKTLYAHCQSVTVAAGDTVAQGQQIATVGNTGNSTGNHCHFEIWSGSTDTDRGTLLAPQDIFPDR